MKDLTFRGGGGHHTKPIYKGDCLKRMGLGQFVHSKRDWQEREGGVFEGRGRGVDTPMPTMR